MIYAGAGNDSLGGGSGDDILVGGQGLNLLHGGAGADAFTADVDSGWPDVIQDYSKSEGDKVRGTHYEISGSDTLVYCGGNILFILENYDASVDGIAWFYGYLA